MSLPEATIQNGTPGRAAAPLMEMQGIKQHYPVHRHLPIGPQKVVKALDGVDLDVRPGETMGVIGESGCGKSTLARVMSGLEKPTEGRVLFRGQDINELKGAEKREMRRNIQLIFQDPFSSLNPRMTVEELVGEPFAIHSEIEPRAGRRNKIRELLELVGLNPDHADRYPHNFSGGQQQRIGIARGIALNPKMLICDEPVSALDVSVRAQIVNLLDTLQKELGLSYLFIAHDLQIVRHISDRVATMYLGKVVELGRYDEVYDRTGHPYTQALLSAAPELRKNDGADRERIVLQGDPPSPIDPPSGCRFHTRCPLAQAMCVDQEPEPVEISGTHAARCHFADTVSAQ
ncbi:MAG: ABC transporter ATP-binding protein [Arthrobacter sp.]|uniref:ABC transporter ATP-binding protein n=1 Tax=unclassified Arthrobacter TaxID=235627 RepID=UPI00264B5BCF|nr:dipeptide ABC transporter ATP-binding protein [Micrococcaceae bacterium]MDN5811661.1 dipeptide ABC transporter ATP-binding protein [Micrococcaceae bacterium]MDN5822784.1 dipeptide ABC transporter ATP-binding protein [Micrococcaceae bacterium]MDN5879254.1 dipeptide ABC transporter ATP-binding protein [Micrococcaceae bacterium]MDN5886010.1 dipeptide ABC transporter ATP-binding protein [Micrococcaceae bacterium]